MSDVLSLSPDELLSTTRAVRKRLDCTREVPREVLFDCVRLAQQAPSGSNTQNFHFVVVTDADQRAALADIWRRGFEIYRTLPFSVHHLSYPDPSQQEVQPRIVESVDYLSTIIADVPVHVIPCVEGRPDGQPAALQSAVWGSVLPAVWSFMLALRSRGLGSCWTSFAQFFEEETAAVIGVPYDQYAQVALLPVAYTKGTTFKAANRLPTEQVIHWDRW